MSCTYNSIILNHRIKDIRCMKDWLQKHYCKLLQPVFGDKFNQVVASIPGGSSSTNTGPNCVGRAITGTNFHSWSWWTAGTWTQIYDFWLCCIKWEIITIVIPTHEPIALALRINDKREQLPISFLSLSLSKGQHCYRPVIKNHWVSYY